MFALGPIGFWIFGRMSPGTRYLGFSLILPRKKTVFIGFHFVDQMAAAYPTRKTLEDALKTMNV